jgi:hypothetical protein
MKKFNAFSNKILLAGFLLLVSISCTKENQIERKPEYKEPYILNKIRAFLPLDSSSYFKVEFGDSVLLYTSDSPNIRFITTSSSGLGSMIGKGISIHNSASEEYFDVMFYNDDIDSVFSFQLANYRYGNPWTGISGANIEYYTPTDQPSTFNRYLGTNEKNAYFRISWLNENHIFGQFRTRLVECCGDTSTFWVRGEFLIPRIYFDD